MYYHFSHKPLKFEDLRDIKPWQEEIWIKPEGLLLSYEIEFLEFIMKEMPHFITYYNYATEIRFKPDTKKKLLKINSLKSVLKITEKYGGYLGSINWKEVAKEYAGIIVTNYHKVYNRLSYMETSTIKNCEWFLNIHFNCIYLWNVSDTVKSIIPIEEGLSNMIKKD